MGKMENGGVEAVVMNYYRHIDRSKIQFDFIVDNDSSCPQESEILSLGGKVIRIAPYQSIIANMHDLKRLFKENNYKIVHSELTTMSVFSLAVAKVCGVPVRICHGHNTACKGETKKNIMKYMLRPFSKTFATHYFACSDYAGKWLYGRNIIKSKKYHVIPNAIDTEKYRFNPEIRDEVRCSLGIEDKFVIGHIGRFVYQKNHDFLIDIFNEVHKQNHNAVLLLIGEGILLDDVKSKVHRPGLDNAVMFLGVR
ncbi:MAG: glycosyltransferase, partial [Ruminococcus sp.]|nr:glycosyltransferase [Ruminococcus sp.]